MSAPCNRHLCVHAVSKYYHTKMAPTHVMKSIKTASAMRTLSRLSAARAGASATSFVKSGADAASSEAMPQTATPVLQLGNWLINPSGATGGHASCVLNFGLATLDLQQDKSQGRQGTGDLPAENPRNDVPPVTPEEREANPEVPASPDETSGKANQAEYSSPGVHPAQKGKDDRMKPDMDNANPAATQQAHAADIGSVTFRDAEAACEMREYVRDSRLELQVESAPNGLQLEGEQDSSSVFTAPVEMLLETPLETDDNDSSTGPASHKDDPQGQDTDPNQVPPADDQKGTDKGGDQ